jgi:V/A-type H+-transporting ATPase subunit C
MVAFVREGIDADNAATALLLAGARKEGDPAEYFIEGGARLSREDFVRAAGAPDRTRSADVLARAVRGGTLPEALAGTPLTASAVARRVLSARIAQLTHRRRLDPLTALPVLLFVLRLRREAEVVRRALWRASLGGGGRA